MAAVIVNAPKGRKGAFEEIKHILDTHPSFQRRRHRLVYDELVISAEEYRYLTAQITARAWPLKHEFAPDERATYTIKEVVDSLSLLY